MTLQASPTNSYDGSWSLPGQSHSRHVDDEVSERLRQSAHDAVIKTPDGFIPLQSPVVPGTGSMGSRAARTTPTTMSDIHEYSFDQIAAGSNALEEAHKQAYSRLSADVGDISSKARATGEFAFLDAPIENASNAASANDAIWGAVCESVFKESARPLTLLHKRQEASESAALKCVEEGETHRPPGSSQAEHMAFVVTAQADQTYGISRAKFASLKVGDGEDSRTMSGAIHTNAKGTFFNTPDETYQLKFNGDRLALQQPDGQLLPSELLGRRRPKEHGTAQED
jgi:hypothetical protein